MIYTIFPFLAISIWIGVLSLNLYVSLYSGSSNQQSEQFNVGGYNTKQQVLRRRSKVSTMNDVMEGSSTTSSSTAAMQYYDLHNSGTKIIVNITTDNEEEASSSRSCECELMSVDCLDSIRCLLLQNRDTRQHMIAAGIFTRHLIKSSVLSSSSKSPQQDFYLFDYANTPIGKALQYDAIESWDTLKEGRGIGRRDRRQKVHDPFIDDTTPYCVKHNLLGRSCVYRSYYQTDIDEEEELNVLEEKALNNHDAKLLSSLAGDDTSSSSNATNVIISNYDEIHYQMRTQPFMTFAHLVRILFNRQPHVREFYNEHVKTKGARRSNYQLPILRVSLHIRRADSCGHEKNDEFFESKASPLDSIPQPTNMRMCYATSVYISALRRIKEMSQGTRNIHVYLSSDYAGSILDDIERQWNGGFDDITWHYLDYSRDMFDYDGVIESDGNNKKGLIGMASIADLWHLSNGEVYVGHLGSRFSKSSYMLATARSNTFVPFYSVDGHSICCQIDEQCAKMKPYITSIDDCLTFASDLSVIDSAEEDYWEVGSTNRKTEKLMSVGLLEINEQDKLSYYNKDIANKKAPVADWSYYPKENEQPLVKDPDRVDDFDPAKCEIDYLQIDTSPPPVKPPSNGMCDGYDGVLHVQHFDWGGGSGTIFFQFMVGILQWADQHNFLPWVHMDDFTKPIFDKVVHTQGPNRSFKMMDGVKVGLARDYHDDEYWLIPGQAFLVTDSLQSTVFEVEGTGIWEHYFMPLTNYVPGDPSCENKPLVKFEDVDIAALHASAPWAPRAWRYMSANHITQPDLTYDEWFEPQRQHAAKTVKRYIRFNSMIESRARCILPNTDSSLGMHIRHGDKQGAREIIPTKAFLKYAQAFVKHGGKHIFLATDSALVLEEIHDKWPKNVRDKIIHQPNLGLTRNTTAAFDLGISQHRTNIEALTEISVLSKCTYLLHGLSAMSEAAMYINPSLVKNAINLEDTDQQKWKTVDYFVENMIKVQGSVPVSIK